MLENVEGNKMSLSDKEIRDDLLRNSVPDLSDLTLKNILIDLAMLAAFIAAGTFGIKYLCREREQTPTRPNTEYSVGYNVPEKR